MAQIRIDLAETLVDGMDIKFRAPCSCSEITGLAVYYPKEDGTSGFKEFVFRDAHGNDLTGMGNLFSKDAYVKVVVDVENGYAYPQNADNNSFLNSAIFGTYTHDAENLIGWGENGKFKATVSGTISSINVNGVRCSVRCGEDTSMDLIAGCWYTFILDGTTVNFNSGGAGAGLNFKVVGDTTKPVSPSENMIWVNTNKINNYYFSATQPENMVDYDVWFLIGTSSVIAFNALKKNGIRVYPISAKQYVSGAWVVVTAMSYQGGEWVEWLPEGSLYYKGNEVTHITGGWEQTSWLSATLGTVTRNSESITLDGSNRTNAFIVTKEKINLAGYTTIKLNALTCVGNESSYGIPEFFIVDINENPQDANKISRQQMQTGAGVKSADITSINGQYYVAVSAGSWANGTVKLEFDHIWLE